MLPLEERLKDRARRRALAERENSPAPQTLQPQDQLSYDDMKVPELRQLLADRGHLVPANTKRAELLEMLAVLDQGETKQPDTSTQSQIPQIPGNLGTPWANKE